MARHKNYNWNVGIANSDGVYTWDQLKVSVLMDIRDELQTLNAVLRCPNFQQIPSKLDAIRLNTTKPKRRKAEVK